ncbi:MAG: HlyD family efflux transporter periplasmic adaptor subunit [Proteobacteria bacterium]|nr:HlyD family efflux transporter periplasmic adaptor subunit [Pseudomonadota bacterium]
MIKFLNKNNFHKKSLLLAIFLLILTGCNHHHTYLGYVEGRLTYVSSPSGGKLIDMPVTRGEKIKVDQILYQLDPQPEAANVDAAAATVNQISEDLADKLKGQRPSELQATTAQLEQAQAQLEYAKKDLERKQQLFEQKVIEQNQLDLAKQSLKTAQAQVKQYQALLDTGNLPAREDQIKSLQAQLASAKANLAEAQWHLSQKTMRSAEEAQVFDTYYQVGEMVPGNQPVLSLLAPKDIKVVFFIDEAMLGKIRVGEPVEINCDGCSKLLKATVRYISPSAEYTPPVIYSRGARSKLVYEVEAEFAQNGQGQATHSLNPGDPVEVTVLTR